MQHAQEVRVRELFIDVNGLFHEHALCDFPLHELIHALVHESDRLVPDSALLRPDLFDQLPEDTALSGVHTRTRNLRHHVEPHVIHVVVTEHCLNEGVRCLQSQIDV